MSLGERIFFNPMIWVIFCCFIVFLISMSNIRRPVVIENKESERILLDFDEIMHIVNQTMLQVMEFRVELLYKTKRDGFVFDFNTELKSIVNDVMESLSPELIKQAERYVNRNYLIGYITKKSEIFLIERIKNERR